MNKFWDGNMLTVVGFLQGGPNGLTFQTGLLAVATTTTLNHYTLDFPQVLIGVDIDNTGAADMEITINGLGPIAIPTNTTYSAEFTPFKTILVKCTDKFNMQVRG